MSGQENQSFWDEVLDCEFEEKEYQDGFKEGVEAGKLQSLRDGVEFGKQKGEELAKELAYYKGYVLVLHHFSVEKLNVKLLSEKQNKLIARLWELLNQFPQFQVEDDDFSEDLMRIRSKFKLLEAQVNTQFRSLSVDRLPRIQDLTF